MNLKGTFTALITPFDDEGEIDYFALENLMKIQVQNKVGLLVLGTTGETPTLNNQEKEEIIKLAIKIGKGKVPIMVGTGTNSTYKTLEDTKKAKELGADVALIVTPYYNKPTDEGIYQHFKSINDQVDIPLIVYNIQGRTAKNINTKLLKRLNELKNVVGVKEASGDINQMMDVIHTLPKDFLVFSGDDSMTLPLISLGGCGVISVISNIYPKEISEMVNLSLAGDFGKAKELHYKLIPFIRAAFIETNPIPIKTAMAIKGIIKENYRLPICKISDANRDVVKGALL